MIKYFVEVEKMEVFFVGNQSSCGDFNVHEYGDEQCVPGYAFGPYIRSTYFFHYIYSGKGIFEAEGKTHELNAGQMFLICPGQLTYYAADKYEPWHYRWISFDGGYSEILLKSAGLSADSPVFTDHSGNAGKALKEITKKRGRGSFCSLMSAFWSFADAISTENEKNAPAEEYVKMAKAQIHSHYMEQLTVGEIAGRIGIDRSYLCRLFKAAEGLSPKEYLIEYRLNLAKRFLRETDCSVSAAARLVGYNDSLDFSKIFKSRFGISPSKWKKEAEL